MKQDSGIKALLKERGTHPGLDNSRGPRSATYLQVKNEGGDFQVEVLALSENAVIARQHARNLLGATFGQ